VYYLVLGRTGYEILRNQAGDLARCGALHPGCIHYGIHHRLLCVPALRNDVPVCGYQPAHGNASCFNLLLYRFGFRFGILRSRGLVLKHNLRPLLELESGSNDPIAYMLTVMFIGIIRSGTDPNIGMVVLTIIIQLVVGAGMGYLLGRGAVIIINRIRMANASLYPILLLTMGIFIFAATYFLKGNGYLAVYIAGLVIGNSKFTHKRTSMKFMDGFAWMSQILLFLTLGLLVNPGELIEVLIPALIISFFLIFIGRPLAVFLTLAPFRKISFRDKLYVSWVGLRGAVPIIFAILPLSAGIPHCKMDF